LLEHGTTDARAFYETPLRCNVEGWGDLVTKGLLGKPRHNFVSVRGE
jgi:hypothetical protein